MKKEKYMRPCLKVLAINSSSPLATSVPFGDEEPGDPSAKSYNPWEPKKIEKFSVWGDDEGEVEEE